MQDLITKQTLPTEHQSQEIGLEKQKERLRRLKGKVLFNKFSAIWLQKWNKPLEDKEIYDYAQQEWQVIFDILDDEQIIFAIETCKRTCDFPPSISEFLIAGLDIPSLALARRGNNGSLFCHILYHRRLTQKMGMMTGKEADYYFREQYEALKEEFLTDECREIEEYEQQRLRQLQQNQAEN